MPDDQRAPDLAQLQAQVLSLQSKVESLDARSDVDRVSLVVFSGELDRLIAAFVIATGAAAMGTEVNMFFTFWGTAALRKKVPTKKNTLERLISSMIPGGTRKAKTSRLQLAGGGPVLFRHLMKKNGVASLDDMLEMSKDMDININICTMSMDLLGFQEAEFSHLPDVCYCGAATFLEAALPSRVSMFI